MNTIISLWYLWITMLAIGFVLGWNIYKFFKQPTSKQIENIKQWLIWACIEAEAKFHEGTGVVKLRMVYDWFIEKFPALSEMISFEIFSQWVDDALEETKHIIETNKAINKYVSE